MKVKKRSSKAHNKNLARDSVEATSQNSGLCSTAKSKPAAAGRGKHSGPVGRSASAQKKDSKP